MLLKPDERRVRMLGESVLAALNTLNSELHSFVSLLIPSQEAESGKDSESIDRSKDQQGRQQATIRVVRQRTDAEEKEKQRDANNKSKFNKSYLRVQRGLFVATFLAFAAAAYYAWVAKQQRDTMELTYTEVEKQTGTAAKALRQSQQLFAIQQRAWVGIESVPRIRPDGNGAEWNVKNFGTSPAFAVNTKGENVDQIDKIASSQERICAELGSNAQVLFPGQSGRPQAAIVVGTTLLYIVGCVKYRDQFSSDRWTKFCYERNARDLGVFIACSGYNSTDAESQ